MQGFFMLLILLGVACLASGPIALIISIIALNKTKEMYRRPPVTVEKPLRKEAKPTVIIKKPIEVTKEERPVETVRAAEIEAPKKIGQDLFKAAAERIKEKEKRVAGRKTISLEQRIGTRWILIAGVITVTFAVGFFLKYAYDNDLIGPLGRVVIATILGLVALAIGEITRRRGYGIVAKGVTALGFAILYAAVFSACRFYGLIGSTSAFILSIRFSSLCITKFNVPIATSNSICFSCLDGAQHGSVPIFPSIKTVFFLPIRDLVPRLSLNHLRFQPQPLVFSVFSQTNLPHPISFRHLQGNSTFSPDR